MNGYERIRAALEGRFADTVPVMLHNFMHAAREAGYTMHEFRNDPRIIAGSFIKAVEKYRYDGILVDIDTATLAGAAGVPVDYPDDDPARAHGARLESLDRLDELQPVDILQYRYVNIWLESVRLLKEHFRDDVFIRGNCDQAPFSLASMMRGTEGFMVDLSEDPEGAAKLLEYCTDISCSFIGLMAETGAHMVSNGDSPAGPEMISPRMYRQFALPYEKRVVQAAHAAGLPYALHICGDTTAILDSMLESGADAIELDYKTDVREVLSRYGDRVCLIGNIDPSGVLALGTEEEVERKTRELLDIYSGSPRFVLNAGCAIPPITPERNIRRLVDVARTTRRG